MSSCSLRRGLARMPIEADGGQRRRLVNDVDYAGAWPDDDYRHVTLYSVRRLRTKPVQ